MALHPLDDVHALQIQAGVFGRTAGHTLEDSLALELNRIPCPLYVDSAPPHIFTGNPALLLLRRIAFEHDIKHIESVSAISTGALATAEAGKKWLSVNGVEISRCKSDIVLTINAADQRQVTAGISVKQCNNKAPMNAQLYFTTARGFVNLLERGGIKVSDVALRAMRQFCGDVGFRPSDDLTVRSTRLHDPRRWFWEEIDPMGRLEWESVFNRRQDDISRLLLQKAYLNDPFVPDYLLHKTRKTLSLDETEVAIYSIEELIKLSRSYKSFETRPYSIRKGSYKDPIDVVHLAPRFGIIQMQRGGQAQHPEQLQFNLGAGYFYKLSS